MTHQKLEKEYWRNLRTSLNNSYDYNNDWLDIINRFKKRVENYYFNPIDKVTEPEILNGEGFSILTIQCAVIEMLAAFRQGKIHNHKKPKSGGLRFQYKWASECFIRFLNTESIFKDHFFKIYRNNQRKKDRPFKAQDFYDKVRCGLMHEGRTKKEWKVNAKKDIRYDGTETIFITKNSDKTISIDRKILNKQLRNYFDNYIEELKEPTDKGRKLRRFLGRKLDHLFDFDRDLVYDWWKDK